MPVALPQLHATGPPWNASMHWLLLTCCTRQAHQRGAKPAHVASLLITCLMRSSMCTDPTSSEACATARQLVDLIAAAGPDVVIDIDNALCRESLQVIGARAALSSRFWPLTHAWARASVHTVALSAASLRAHAELALPAKHAHAARASHVRAVHLARACGNGDPSGRLYWRRLGRL